MIFQSGQVRFDRVPGLGSPVLTPEGDHLVEHEQRAVRRGPLAQYGDEPGVGGDQTDTMRHQVEEHAGDLALVPIEYLEGPLRRVEGDDNHVGEHTVRSPEHRRHARRILIGAPVRWARGLADFGIVVGPVIGALDLGDLGPPGEGTSGLDGNHHGLGSRVDEPDLLEPGIARPEVLGEPDLDLGGQCVGSAPADLPSHCLDDCRGGHGRG